MRPAEAGKHNTHQLTKGAAVPNEDTRPAPSSATLAALARANQAIDSGLKLTAHEGRAIRSALEAMTAERNELAEELAQRPIVYRDPRAADS